MLCRHGTHPSLIGRKDRQDVDEPETERRGRDEKGRGTRQAFYPGRRTGGPTHAQRAPVAS